MLHAPAKKTNVIASNLAERVRSRDQSLSLRRAQQLNDRQRDKKREPTTTTKMYERIEELAVADAMRGDFW